MLKAIFTHVSATIKRRFATKLKLSTKKQLAECNYYYHIYIYILIYIYICKKAREKKKKMQQKINVGLRSLV